jgi:4-hydroxy-3-methylbut-2-enyl diphosphate reductase
MSKRVLLAAPRGYCAGVDRAVITVEKALELYGAPVYVRKQIVHNKHVVATLEARGAIFVDQTDEVPEGKIVVFSAHGVSPAVHEEAADRNLKTIDATCPLVTKVHHEAKRFAAEDLEILFIGHEGHEEVEGTMGEAVGKVKLVDGLDSARTIEPTPGKKLAWLSQTTLSVDEALQSVAILKERFPEIQDPPSDAIKVIAPQADLVIVVGSTNSSNSVRLVEVAKEYGTPQAYLIDYAAEAKEEWLTGVETIGVTSGASVPEILVDDLLKWLAERGFGEVETVTAAQESLLFALPPELRKDLKAAAQA